MRTETEPLVYESILERDGVRVSKSPWGPDDEIGRLNWITAETRKHVLDAMDPGSDVACASGGGVGHGRSPLRSRRFASAA